MNACVAGARANGGYLVIREAFTDLSLSLSPALRCPHHSVVLRSTGTRFLPSTPSPVRVRAPPTPAEGRQDGAQLCCAAHRNGSRDRWSKMERWPPWSPRVPTWVPTRGARRCPRAAALLVQINKEAARRGGAGTPKATCRPTTGRPGQRARQTAHAIGVRCAAAALPRLVGLLAAAPRISRQLATNTTSPLTLGCRNQKQGAPCSCLSVCTVHRTRSSAAPARPAGSKEGFQSGAEPNQRPAQHPHPGEGIPC
jgi:hypothetical protein